MDLPAELTQRYKSHIFACVNQRPPQHPKGSCGARAAPLLTRLKKAIEEKGLKADVGCNEASCMDACAAGPLMVIYPEGVWYSPQTPEDIDRIVETHLIGGALVEDIAVLIK